MRPRWRAPKARWPRPRRACPHQERFRARPAVAGFAHDLAARSRPALNAYREAEANLQAAEAALQSAKLNLDYTEVRAPVAGRVGKLEITVGNLVAAGPGAPVLTTLVSVNPIYASFNADEQVVTRALQTLGDDASTHVRDRAHPGADGRPATSNGTPYKGKMQLIDNQVDARSGTVRVRAVFDNADGRLMPGQFARLRMGQPKAEPALADQRTRRRHRPEQEIRDGRRRRQQGGLPRSGARRRRSTACAW